MFELTVFEGELRDAIERNAAPRRLRELAQRAGCEPMTTNARELVLGHETSLEEIARVLDLGGER